MATFQFDNNKQREKFNRLTEKAMTLKGATALKGALKDILELLMPKPHAAAIIESIVQGIPVNLKNRTPMGVVRVAARFMAYQVAELASKNAKRTVIWE